MMSAGRATFIYQAAFVAFGTNIRSVCCSCADDILRAFRTSRGGCAQSRHRLGHRFGADATAHSHRTLGDQRCNQSARARCVSNALRHGHDCAHRFGIQAFDHSRRPALRAPRAQGGVRPTGNGSLRKARGWRRRRDGRPLEASIPPATARSILDRQLAEKRIFPAINIQTSGARKEEKLSASASTRR
jgi:hypothetical protein